MNTPASAPPAHDPTLRPHRGPLILVFGILGLISCFPFGIAAWILGNSDLREMRTGRMDPSGEPLTQGGRICGMIATILAILAVCAAFVFFVLFALVGIAAQQ